MALHSRRFIRALVVIFTMAALLSIPLQAAAGSPRGTKATLTNTALTSAVSVGRSAASHVVFSNTGTANFTHVTLSGSAPGATLQSAPQGCAGSGASVTCNFDSLRSGRSLTLLFVFGAPGSAGDINFASEVRIDSGSNNPRASSKDTFKATGAAAVINSPNFFGSWQGAHANGLTFATAGIGGTNTQTTSVEVPPVGFGYPAALNETDAPIVCDGNDIGGFGNAVDLSIANGTEVSPHLTLTLTYAKSAIGHLDAWKVKFVHQTDEGTCEFPPRGCTYHNDGFCFDAKWVGSGSSKKLVIRVELPSNGRGKGF